MDRAVAPTLLLVIATALIAGCDRNIEPFDANEQPREPDLSRIFPEGAERAAQIRPGLPEPPRAAPGRGAPPLAAEAGVALPAGAGAASGAPISGTVRIADALSDSVPIGAVLFIIARRAAPGPPLAVKRISAPRFPFEFSLGPDDRMIQAMPFEGPLQVTARVDADGNATSRDPGNLHGEAAGSFQPGATGIEVVIDEVL